LGKSGGNSSNGATRDTSPRDHESSVRCRAHRGQA
jgi:hypothetical protein